MKTLKNILFYTFSTTAFLSFIGISGINLDYPGWRVWLFWLMVGFFGSIGALFILDDPRRAKKTFIRGLTTVTRAIVLFVYGVFYNVWKAHRRVTRARQAFKMDPECSVAFTYRTRGRR